jgi:outer membrane protein TolC
MKKFLLIILLPCVSATCFSQKILTLAAAIDSALRKNLDIAIARNGTTAAAVNNHISIAGGLPTVSGTLNDQEQVTAVNQKLNTGTDINRNNAASNNLQVGVTGSMLVFNGWRVVATKKRLEELQKLSEAQLAAQIQNVVAAVMVSYYDVVRQEDYLGTLSFTLSLAQKRLEIFQVRKDVGLANNVDIFQAQIDVNTIRQNIAAQQLVLNQSKIGLMDLMNTADSSFRIVDSIVVDHSLSLEPILKSIEQNPEVLAAQQQVRVNEQVVKEVAAQRYPAIRVNGGYNFSRNQAAAGNILLNQNYGPFIGLNVQVPIFNGGATKRQIKVAEINTSTAVLQKDNVISTLNTSALSSFQSYQATLQQLQQAKDNYDLSRRLVDLTIQRFNLNVATIIEVREAQRSLEEAGFRLVNLSYAAKVAEIELKRLGNLLPL